MPRTKQLNIRLTRDEKKALTSAAKASGLTVPAYVRGRLFGPELSQADQALMDGLRAFGPHMQASLAVIDANIDEIKQLRAHSMTDEARPG